jgi:hypothetical protein
MAGVYFPVFLNGFFINKNPNVSIQIKWHVTFVYFCFNEFR